ncbi:hypothetical protein VI817_007175 [Penicillium citrinum]|nr:hypothetical protein VI817_007175 [Penicillium citrinum]
MYTGSPQSFVLDNKQKSSLPSSSFSQKVSPSDPSLDLHDSSTMVDFLDPSASIKSAPKSSSSSFRNVSACHRCRMRKHKCDQNLPQCQSCAKAQVQCVGYDPITKQEIPRSYVYFLENRIQSLNAILMEHNIEFNYPTTYSHIDTKNQTSATIPPSPTADVEVLDLRTQLEVTKPDNLKLSESSDYSDSAILDLLTGKDAKIEIMRKDHIYCTSHAQRTSIRSSLFSIGTGATFNGSMKLPDREVANQLVDEYFIHTNLHVPVLHRPDFENMIDEIYSAKDSARSKQQLYFAFIVFAIGAASMSNSLVKSNVAGRNFQTSIPDLGKRKRSYTHSHHYDDYYASAMACLENCFNLPGTIGLTSDLEELQAVILLCSFALFESTSQGLGTLLDLAIRSAIDLRLYSEHEHPPSSGIPTPTDSNNTVHVDWLLDLRRRLWWCVYSLDRLVAPYLERAFFIPDDVVTTHFPSTLDDKFITRRGPLKVSNDRSGYKYAARHRFKFRVLQSEIHTVLQHRYSLVSKRGLSSSPDHNVSSVLGGFSSFGCWRQDMISRLETWRASIPMSRPQADKFLMELDFWQSVIALYRWSVVVPPELVQGCAEINSTIQALSEETPEELQTIYFKVTEATSTALHLHRMIQNTGTITAPYLTAQEIFIAASLLLFTVWNSRLVREKLLAAVQSWQSLTALKTFRSLDYSTLAALAGLDRLKKQCRFAKKSMTILEGMSTITTQMKLAEIESPTEGSFSNKSFLFQRTSRELTTGSESLVSKSLPDMSGFSDTGYSVGNSLFEANVHLSQCSPESPPDPDGPMQSSWSAKRIQFSPQYGRLQDVGYSKDALSTPESLQSSGSPKANISEYISDFWSPIEDQFSSQDPESMGTGDTGIHIDQGFFDTNGWT